MLKWWLGTDLLTLLCINSIFLFALIAANRVSKKIALWIIVPAFTIINSFAIILNTVDIFYFPFHLQRSNADLLYVIDHPLNRLLQQKFWLIIGFTATLFFLIWLMWRMHKKLYTAFTKGNNCKIFTALLCVSVFLVLVFKKSFTKILVPTYPLVELTSNQLPVVQNSFHTFAFSVLRAGKAMRIQNYMPVVVCDSIFPIRKKLSIINTSTNKKNIVLFIMESVPYDFFDSASAYKVRMPFFDSLLQRSTFFNNAFSYGHESNKGITAILAGIPTLSDIPVYHSPYINICFTPIGKALQQMNYRSLFCIGDEYDNFGFAKFANWLGINKYYSKEDIPGYKKLPAHTMGLQDEYVLDFFNQKIDAEQKPFFAVQYNISTHYPYNIPAGFAKQSPGGYNPAMKAMQYYDYSLRHFFYAAKNESWFANTIFIFCSDHWLFPQAKRGGYAPVFSNRIPIIIYDAAATEKKIDNRLASQFDVHATILAAAGYRDSIISYGNNLLDSRKNDQYVFTKSGSTVYQVIDSSYVLGFNIITNKVEYLYNYKADRLLSKNLANDKTASATVGHLLIRVKAFLQKATSHYGNKAVK